MQTYIRDEIRAYQVVDVMSESRQLDHSGLESRGHGSVVVWMEMLHQ